MRVIWAVPVIASIMLLGLVTSSSVTIQNVYADSAPTCPSGLTFNPTTNLCEGSSTPICPADTTFNPDTDQCEPLVPANIPPIPPTCPSGLTFNPTTDLCEGSSAPTCPQNTTFDPESDLCVDEEPEPEPEGKNNPCDALEKAETKGNGKHKGIEKAKSNNDCE